MKTICVLFGGRSSEYDVSLSSAYAVLTNIDRSAYRIICVGITREGAWYRFDGPVEDIRSDRWCAATASLPTVDLSLTTGAFGFTYPDGRREEVYCDAVFPMLHGKYGEDGTLQGMLAVAGIPVVGCGCTSSGVCMDKALTKFVVASDTPIRQARAVVARETEMADMEGLRKKCEEKLGYPMFVKPCAAGSSVGVSKVKTPDAFAAAVEKAFREDGKILIEETIVGKEIEVAVFEDHGQYFVSQPAEIDLGSSEFYDYDTKYVSDVSSYYLPARLTAEQTETVRKYAETIFRALDCRVFSRVDFFITEEGFVFNEINTIPGFTPISMYPKMMIHSGMTYSQLIDKILSASLDN